MLILVLAILFLFVAAVAVDVFTSVDINFLHDLYGLLSALIGLAATALSCVSIPCILTGQKLIQKVGKIGGGVVFRVCEYTCANGKQLRFYQPALGGGGCPLLLLF